MNKTAAWSSFISLLWLTAMGSQVAAETHTNASLQGRALLYPPPTQVASNAVTPSSVPPDQGLESLHQEAALYNQKGHRRLEAYTLSRIAKKLAEQGEASVAIAFYKRSLNLVESVRADLRRVERLGLRFGLDAPDFQATLVETFSQDIYRPLADLLLQQNRIVEAQDVLDLLHVQELDEYLENVEIPPSTRQGQAVAGSSTPPAVTLQAPEAKIIADYEVLQRQAVHKGERLAQLRQIAPDQRSAEQQSQIAELTEFQQALSRQFNAFSRSESVLGHINQLSQNTQQQNLNLTDLNALRDNLRQIDGAVLLYPLVLPDRLELILTTANSPPLRYSVAVSQPELEATIQDFRSSLRSTSRDPKPSGQKLYRWLIEPIAADLVAAGAKTIIYAPDGQLRYIPLAALHDGDQWLVERFRINHITARSLTDLNRKPRSQPRILAAAFVEGSYEFEIGQRNLAFSGLPFAGFEVQALASRFPDVDVVEDQAFSPQSLVPRMDDYHIVHLATHASLVSGAPESSFILFGDGTTVTLRDLETWSLPNVDLVVLSACETGLGQTLGNGMEVLGLGYQIQRTGAKAAIASLWQVDDGGTQQYMDVFYRQLQSPGTSKTEALRQAQLALIHGQSHELGAAGGEGQRGALAFTPPELPAEIRRSSLSHPYYWAPFILIGNGL